MCQNETVCLHSQLHKLPLNMLLCCLNTNTFSFVIYSDSSCITHNVGDILTHIVGEDIRASYLFSWVNTGLGISKNFTIHFDLGIFMY